MSEPEPSVVSAECTNGVITLTLRWPHRQEFVPLSVGDAFTLATQLTAAQEAAIAWQAEHGEIVQVNV